MTESNVIYRSNSDNELKKMKNTSSPTSRSSTPTNSAKSKRTRLSFPFGACRVCSDSATGIHYGIATCEGCKGFFKRSILRKEKYRCYFDSTCLVNVTNRNRCKACRFKRCIDKGMSVDGVKMGRIPKLVKERALLEQKEQQMREEASLVDNNERSNEVHARESSCSSLSDRSIENYDPNTMETVMQVLTMRHSSPSSKIHSNAHLSQNNSSLYNDRAIDHAATLSNLSEHSESSTLIYRTRHSTYLPDDFTLDETDSSSEHPTGFLPNDVVQYVYTISNKLSQNKSSSFVHFTDDELMFLRFLRWSSYNIYVRHSKRIKQLEMRMHQMIFNGINEYPGDNATSAQFLSTVPKTLEVTVRSSVFYIQELPGMANIGSSNLHKIILNRAFDWYMLKYASLLNGNDECYILSSDGFQYTHRWMNTLYGVEMVDSMFNFSKRLRNLHLNESEYSLIIPLQICYSDSTMQDQNILQMLRSCYLYALYQELCQNRGENEGKIMSGKILQVLDLLIPLNESYEKNVGSRLLET